MTNPYKPSSSQPMHRISRASLLERVVTEIQRGDGGYLVACRGMGKSVFVDELEETIHAIPDYEVISLHGPPPELSVERIITKLVDALIDQSEHRDGDSSKIEKQLRKFEKRHSLEGIFDAYFAAASDVERLVLLYDELDAYAGQAGKGFFASLETSRKRSDNKLVIFGAGGTKLMALDTIQASPLFSRSDPYFLDPFTREQLVELAFFFEEEQRPLSDEVIDTLLLACGGNGYMTTYGLHYLWEMADPTARDVSRIFAQFVDRRDKIIQHIRAPIFSPEQQESRAPSLIWEQFSLSDSPTIPNRKLRQVVQDNPAQYPTSPQWVLNMLRATGLIRCEDDAYRQPTVRVELIPSILTMDLPRGEGPASSLRERLMLDLPIVLARIHRMSVDFFRTDGTKESKKQVILPEAVFSAMICIGLDLMGWRVEREAQSAAGRADIKARHSDFGELLAIIEVKIWDRNDKTIHEQVESYWTGGVEALATVMVSHLVGDDWPAKYKKRCLEGKVESFKQREISPPLAGHFVAASKHVDEVDHLLLKLAKR